MNARRRGYSLAECLVAITICGAVLATAALTLQTLNRAERRRGDDLSSERLLDRFVTQLRTDTHQALAATVGEPRRLSLSLAADRSIEYTLADGEVERVVRRGAAVEHRETYPVAVASAGWEFQRDRPFPRVSLAVPLPSADPATNGPASPSYRFEAVVGLIRPAPPAAKP